MEERQKDLLKEAAKKMRESAELLESACGECKHPNAKPAGQRLMGQKVMRYRCPDCELDWVAPVQDLRPGPNETTTFGGVS